MFGFFEKILSPFAKKIRALFSKPVDDEALEHLEQIFFEADLGAKMAAELTDKDRVLYKQRPQMTSDEILNFVKLELLKCIVPQTSIQAKPLVIFLVGVNGSGKTTSLAKLASHYVKVGKKVLIAAGDTFR